MVDKMNNQIKQRLYITLVAFTLLWLLCMGVINEIQIQETRSLAFSECLKDNFNLFDLCHNKTNNDIYPKFWYYITPFIPALILLWLTWVFKLNFQIDAEGTSNKFIKITVGLVYFVAFFGFIFPFDIVFEKDVERIYQISFNSLFFTPWLAISWISIPIFFQKLLDSEKRISEFTNLNRVVYVVAASPILAIISLVLRQELKM